eukprot:2540840-Amphidinium_carterae.1
MGSDPFRGQGFSATFSTTSSLNVTVNPVNYERAPLPPQPPPNWSGYQATGSPQVVIRSPPGVSRTPSPVQMTRVYPDHTEAQRPRPQIRIAEAYREWWMSPPADMAQFMEGYCAQAQRESRGRPPPDMSLRGPVSRSRSPREAEEQDIGVNYVQATIREQNNRLIATYEPQDFQSCYHCRHFVLQRRCNRCL